jgi:hypothetical protein
LLSATIMMSTDTARRWFRRVVWLGIIANLALGVPTLLAPARMLAMTGLPVTDPLMWTRFAALLLILLSLFYMPAAIDPARYRMTAFMTVASRLVGVLFFLTQPREYLMLGLLDLVFLIPEAILVRGATQPDPVFREGAVR